MYFFAGFYKRYIFGLAIVQVKGFQNNNYEIIYYCEKNLFTIIVQIVHQHIVKFCPLLRGTPCICRWADVSVGPNIHPKPRIHVPHGQTDTLNHSVKTKFCELLVAACQVLPRNRFEGPRAGYHQTLLNMNLI